MKKLRTELVPFYGIFNELSEANFELLTIKILMEKLTKTIWLFGVIIYQFILVNSYFVFASWGNVYVTENTLVKVLIVLAFLGFTWMIPMSIAMKYLIQSGRVKLDNGFGLLAMLCVGAGGTLWIAVFILPANERKYGDYSVRGSARPPKSNGA